MSLAIAIQEFRTDRTLADNVVEWRTIPAEPPRFEDWPDNLDQRVIGALARRGINRPYTHQAQAIDHALDGNDTVVVTPTASGKTLCYNVPVLESILRDPDARALYLFPTKALAQDQLGVLKRLVAENPDLADRIRPATYDGDTPTAQRRSIRQSANLILSNPAAAPEAVELPVRSPVTLRSKAGNRLGYTNVYWVLDESVATRTQTRVAGIPIHGNHYSEFSATEASRKLLADGPEWLGSMNYRTPGRAPSDHWKFHSETRHCTWHSRNCPLNSGKFLCCAITWTSAMQK